MEKEKNKANLVPGGSQLGNDSIEQFKFARRPDNQGRVGNGFWLTKAANDFFKDKGVITNFT